MALDFGLEDAGYHVNQSVWAYSGDQAQFWIETGVTRGYRGQHVYAWYYAYNTAFGYADFMAGQTTWDGSNHCLNGTYVGDAGRWDNDKP